MLTYVYLFAPMVLGYATTMACRMEDDAGANVKFRPPSWVFRVAWPVLYLLLGYSWVLAAREGPESVVAAAYGALILSLTLWIVVYSCGRRKREAAYVIVASVACALVAMTTGTPASRAMLAPLVAWLVFALMMNTAEVQNS